METRNQSESVRPAAFLLVTTRSNAYEVATGIGSHGLTTWATAVFGPFQAAAYVEADDAGELVESIENLRQNPEIRTLDARICKVIPGDEELTPLALNGPEIAVLLINVDYKIELERVVTLNLRQLDGVAVARAMWGPADIIAIVEAEDREAMRNLICDEVKVMKGVLSNTTLYCYP